MVVEKVLIADEAYVTSSWRNRWLATPRPETGTLEHRPGHARLDAGAWAIHVGDEEDVEVFAGPVAWRNVWLSAGVAAWLAFLAVYQMVVGLFWPLTLLAALFAGALAYGLTRSTYWLRIEATVKGEERTLFVARPLTWGLIDSRGWAEDRVHVITRH